VEGGVKKDEME
jgi:hypothetical protein